jgi:maleylacetoacetate isomerase
VKLYTFFRSSAAYRVRIALNLKGVPHELVPIHLLKGGGEQRAAEYKAINPGERVPALELDDGTIITQSLAIIDYLETRFPDPPVYPENPILRANALAVALTVVADIHPVNNLRVLQFLKREFGREQSEIDAWYVHWVRQGFATVEKLVEGNSFCFGDRPSIADLCLVPQVYNARRFHVDMTDFPRIAAIDANLLSLEAFAKARPEAQPDAE